MSLSPLFMILIGPKSISVRIVHSFIEPPVQDNCDCSFADNGISPNYFTTQDMVLMGRSDLVDNITNTVPGKHHCDIMAFT